MSTLIKFSSKAIEKIISLKPDNDSILYISIKGGGCSGMLYNMEWQLIKEVDQSIAFYFQRIWIDDDSSKPDFKWYTDSKSRLFLKNVTLDYEDGLNGKGFTWTNPNSKRTCGCGDSFGV